VIGEVAECSPSGNAWEYVDTSNFQSGADEEYLPTMRNNGEFKATGNRVSANAGQVLVESAYSSGAKCSFSLQLPVNTLAGQATTGDLYTWQGYVMSRTFAVATKKQITYDITSKVSGAVTFTAGS
jgi:hypothetical protein